MNLRIGSSGNDVLDLKTKLKGLGYDVDEDSVFNESTDAAVRKFQQDNGLDVDGIAGTQTLGMLNSLTGGSSYDNLDPVTKANKLLQDHIGTQPGGFHWENQAELDAATERYLNRDPFTFDLTNDPLYRQFREQYSALGLLAMENTMGQAAAMTGGYGNSYAQTVGQQAYNQYMQQLNNIVPDIYAMQLGRYDAEGQQLLNEISLMESQKQSDYAQWTDWLNHLQADAQYQEQLAQSQRSYSGGGSDGGNYTANPGWDSEKIKAFQDAHGITVDGIWGPETADAYDNDKDWVYDPNEVPLTYDDIVGKMNTYIKNGASKSEVSSYLRGAYEAGYITYDEFLELKEQYVPRGYTY